MSNRKRIGIIGCGAVTEVCHLPAARNNPNVEITALVDLNLARARVLAEPFGAAAYDDYSKLFRSVDGVIVATPHNLHAGNAIALLEQKVPVLVEKPLALTADEARRLIAASEANRTPAQAAYMYRFCAGAQAVKQAIDSGWLGRLTSFSLESGGVYSWPAVSGFYWNKERAGGGVLIDTGSHMLDLLLWWLGEVQELDYRDDALGGVEADCEISLTLGSGSQRVEGTVAMSRLRQLSDTARITGDRYTIEYDLSSSHTVRIRPTGSPPEEFTFLLQPSKPQRWIDVYAGQLDAFAMAIASRQTPAVSAQSVFPTVALIEQCYKTRKAVEHEWLGLEPMHCEATR